MKVRQKRLRTLRTMTRKEKEGEGRCSLKKRTMRLTKWRKCSMRSTRSMKRSREGGMEVTEEKIIKSIMRETTIERKEETMSRSNLTMTREKEGNMQEEGQVTKDKAVEVVEAKEGINSLNLYTNQNMKLLKKRLSITMTIEKAHKSINLKITTKGTMDIKETSTLIRGNLGSHTILTTDIVEQGRCMK